MPMVTWPKIIYECKTNHINVPERSNSSVWQNKTISVTDKQKTFVEKETWLRLGIGLERIRRALALCSDKL